MAKLVNGHVLGLMPGGYMFSSNILLNFMYKFEFEINNATTAQYANIYIYKIELNYDI